ncbi:LPD7 domain-containing protein [Candidatus Methylospira mobilis]|uniref:LPD7 domain-containing protein n=1 Tax=Candidatus Methylospira mobilis TaxID=1808979 RepID=UPI0028E51013|nr:LPD7 domain-containing protein [Candidatus Methylospira mobilis]WNV06495.1 LPD7 domain-containing protein [Candidatus Methylospira mobilis]
MLIRIRGGSEGIADYLENGQKQGRDFSRDELDERVILAGDLELTNTLINGMNKEGDRYLHITLAFKEDEIPPETLKGLTDDFKSFALTAFDSDEYHFYAEAHLPKIKSYAHRKTGEFIERKPHIHIVIPQQNLLSGQNLNPFGKVEQQTFFIDAFQEHTNTKYGLASPKDNRRIEFTDASEMISRYKGDVFQGHAKELKARILSEVLEQKITDYDCFKILLAEHGETRSRNAGSEREYLNVKPVGYAKGVNLKDYVFSREFIEKPEAEKQRFLSEESRQLPQAYESPNPQSACAAESKYTDLLNEWRDVRAAEIKYLNSGNRKLYAAYKEAEPEQKKALLVERAERFYQKHRAPAQEREAVAVAQIDSDRPAVKAAALAPARAEPLRAADPNPPEFSRRSRDNVIGQLKTEHHEQAQVAKAATLEEFKQIKHELDARRLLNHLSQTHGLIPEKYSITQGKDGGDRIKAGSRHLNVSDFLTQEMRLSFREAAPILREVYAAQHGRDIPEQRRAPRQLLWEAFRQADQNQQKQRSTDWDAQRQNEKARREQIKQGYQAERRKLQDDKTQRPAERKAALSIVRMQRVTHDMALSETINSERKALKERYNQPYQTRYQNFLFEQASQGDETALAELRRQRNADVTPPALNHIKDSDRKKRDPAHEEQQQTAPIVKNLSHSIDRQGNVTYYADNTRQRALIVDREKRVDVEAAQDNQAVEIGLRLAMQKFGAGLKIEGSDDFKEQVIKTALKTGLRVEFDNPAMNEELQRRRVEHQDNLAREQERQQAEAAAKLQKTVPEQERTRESEITQQPPERNKSRGYER